MKDREIIEILGNAFANGEVDALTGLLSDDCEYVSDYSGKKVTSAEKIIKCMKEVYDCITDESRYNKRTYCIGLVACIIARAILEGGLF